MYLGDLNQWRPLEFFSGFDPSQLENATVAMVDGIATILGEGGDPLLIVADYGPADPGELRLVRRGRVLAGSGPWVAWTETGWAMAEAPVGGSDPYSAAIQTMVNEQMKDLSISLVEALSDPEEPDDFIIAVAGNDVLLAQALAPTENGVKRLALLASLDDDEAISSVIILAPDPDFTQSPDVSVMEQYVGVTYDADAGLLVNQGTMFRKLPPDNYQVRIDDRWLPARLLVDAAFSDNLTDILKGESSLRLDDFEPAEDGGPTTGTDAHGRDELGQPTFDKLAPGQLRFPNRAVVGCGAGQSGRGRPKQERGERAQREGDEQGY